MSETKKTKPAKLFLLCSKNERDTRYLNLLRNSLITAIDKGDVVCWHESEIAGGTNIEQTTKEQLQNADFVVPLLSPDFFSDKNCRFWQSEAQKQAKQFIPVVLRPCTYRHNTLYEKLHILPILPANNQTTPVSNPSWADVDEAMVNVADGIIAAVNSYSKERTTAPINPVLDSPSKPDLPNKYPLQNPAVGAAMQLIKGGDFEMGDIFDDSSSMPDGYGEREKPVHKVRLSDFYMSAYCVTFEEFDAFCEATNRGKPDDGRWGRVNRPVIKVNWYDAIEYCNWLSEQYGFMPVYRINKTQKDSCNNNPNDDLKWIVTPNWSANGYRLPTEAEWEYAAREGGKKLRFGNGQNILRPTQANFDASEEYKTAYSETGRYNGKTVPVNSFMPNSLGLYNMTGNVWEWCWDWFNENYYHYSPFINPKGEDSGAYRVVRGGLEH